MCKLDDDDHRTVTNNISQIRGRQDDSPVQGTLETEKKIIIWTRLNLGRTKYPNQKINNKLIPCLCKRFQKYGIFRLCE